MIFLVFLTIVLNAVSLNQVWTPGILQGGLVSAAIRPILGLAGLIILAKLPDLIPEAIFQLKPSPFGKALGEGLPKMPWLTAFELVLTLLLNKELVTCSMVVMQKDKAQ
jgi:hypothetical protein